MSRTVLQIPITAKLRSDAEKTARDEGFSSLPEVVRLFLAKYAKKQLKFNVTETIQLSPRAIKRYNKILDDIDSGKEKVKSFDNVEDMMKYLSK